jgi:hypothetical protein
MKYKTYLTIILLAQVATIAAFIWFARQADKAMDKTGIGNLQLNQHYNSYAGIAFYVAVTLWVASIFVAILGKHFKETSSQIVIVLPPLLLVLGWLSCLFI